jgi:hypothetical protein
MKQLYLIKFFTLLVIALSMRPAFSQCPVADAGPDQALCSDQSAVQLSGNVTGGQATGLKWSSNGTGTFSSTIGLTPIYYPSAADKYTGEVTITLTVKSSTCEPVTNTMIIDLNMLPVIKAGADQVICSVDSAKLTPETIYAPYVAWSSSGSGKFFPSSSTVNASYVPSAADIDAGNVKLTFTASNIAGCPTVVDDLNLKIDKPGTVDAGPDMTICSTTKVFC